MADPTALLTAWTEQNKNLEKLEKATEFTKNKRSGIVKQLFEEHGKGPFEIDGKAYIAINKADTFYLKVAAQNEDGTAKASGPAQGDLDKLVAAVTGPMAAGDIAKAMGTSTGPKLSELIKTALENGLITRTGERAQTKYHPKSA